MGAPGSGSAGSMRLNMMESGALRYGLAIVGVVALTAIVAVVWRRRATTSSEEA